MNERPRFEYRGFYDSYPRTVRKKEKIVYDRECKTCKCKKDGLDTVCEAYKCIPQSVQRGGTCERKIIEK